MKGLHTAFYEKGILIEDRSKIAELYFNEDFIYDLIPLMSIFFNPVFFPRAHPLTLWIGQCCYLLKTRLMFIKLNKVDLTFAMKE